MLIPELILVLGFYLVDRGNYFAYKEDIPENIEFCVHAIHIPELQGKFKQQCSEELTLEYMKSIKKPY